MVFEVAESGEDDDFYTVVLSVRPQGNFDGTPGQEQFVVGKEGTIAVRQVLSLPTQTSASPADTGRKGGFPLLPVGIGVVVVGIIAAIGAVVILMSSGGDSVPIFTVLPTETPALAPVVIPADTPEPTANIDATVEAGIQQGLTSRVTSVPVPVPTATYTPIPPTERPVPPTDKPVPPTEEPRQQSYTLIANASPYAGGSVTGGGTYVSGATATVTATTYQGYDFSGWSGACSGTGYCTVTMDSNKAVTAVFSQQPLVDDYGDLQSTATSIYPPTTLNGYLSTYYDADFLAFQVDGIGEKYIVTANFIAGSNPPDIRLMGSSGPPIASDENHYGLIEYTPSSSGMLYLKIGDSDSGPERYGTGEYKIQIEVVRR